MILQTPRLYLSEFSIADAPGFYTMNANDETLRFTGDMAFENVAQAEVFIKSYDHYQKYGFGRWTIRRIEDKAYIGFCGLKFHPDIDAVDIGYRLDRKYWGKGYATEAAMACLEYGLESLGLKRIIGRVKADHQASIRILEKIGMTFAHDFDFEGDPGLIYEKIK